MVERIEINTPDIYYKYNVLSTIENQSLNKKMNFLTLFFKDKKLEKEFINYYVRFYRIFNGSSTEIYFNLKSHTY